MLVDAEDLYLALADADATASTIFLRAGVEPPELRARYLEDLQRAGRQLATITADRDLSATAQDAIATISEALPEYASLVEAARTNNRLDFPVGAAYQREASHLMSSTILPAATTVFEDAGRQLERGLRRRLVGVARGRRGRRHRASSSWRCSSCSSSPRSRTRRLLNLGLVGATVALVAHGRHRDRPCWRRSAAHWRRRSERGPTCSSPSPSPASSPSGR